MKIKSNFARGLSLTALLCSAITAMAQISYVDAVEGGNTLIAPSAGGGASFTVAPFGTQGPASDGLWDARAFGNSATIFQNAGASGADPTAVRLATSVSGLALDTYEVYAFFWTDSSLNWRLGASLSDAGGQLTLYKSGDAGVSQLYTGADATVFSTALVANPFTTGVMVGEGNRRLLQVSLGQVTGTGFNVFIDPDRNQTTQDQRTWYDGVGYSVVPEPTISAFLGLGVLMGLWRRRQA